MALSGSSPRTGAGMLLVGDTVRQVQKAKPDTVYVNSRPRLEGELSRQQVGDTLSGNSAGKHTGKPAGKKARRLICRVTSNEDSLLHPIPDPEQVIGEYPYGKTGSGESILEGSSFEGATGKIGAVQEAASLNKGEAIEKLIQQKVEQSAYAEMMDALPVLPEALNNPVGDLSKLKNPLQEEQLKQAAIEQASKYLALDALTENLPLIKASQQKFSRYKSRLSWLSDHTGREPNSLAEEPFSKRWVWGLNFQYKTIQPFSMAMAPYLGYRVNKKLTTGASLVATGELKRKKLTMKDVAFSSGYRLYTNYKLIKSFFAHAEYESLYAAFSKQPDNTEAWQWQHNAYLGLGRSIALSGKIKANMYFLANLTHPGLTNLNRNAFQVRLGLEKGN